MALVEEDLPGVSKVRSDFQQREDQVLAQRLQEQEYEDHFNSNVQLRRTARHDVGVAKEIQDRETESFKQEETARLQQLREREEEDRRHAAEMARKLEEEEHKLREREQRDQEHAAEVARKLKEEEDIQMALRMQDEVMAKKMQEAEAKRQAHRRLQEESDARLARQASRGGRQGRPPQEQSLSERDVLRMKQLNIQQGKAQSNPSSQQVNPQHSLDSRLHSQPQANAARPTASLPAGLVGGAAATTTTPSTLPSYDQCVPTDSPMWVGVAGGGVEADGSGEGVMDENERIALQEAEDERLAREMIQKEEDERKKRELEDMEFARRMQEELASSSSRRGQTDHSKDLEMARKLQQEEEAARGKRTQSSHERDMELARRLHQEEVEATKKKKMQQQQQQQQQRAGGGAGAPQDPDVELAMRLQREEVMRHKELKKQRLAQQKVLESERQQQHLQKQHQRLHQQQQLQQQQQQQPQQQQQKQAKSASSGKQQNSSPFAGYEVPPLPDEVDGNDVGPQAARVAPSGPHNGGPQMRRQEQDVGLRNGVGDQPNTAAQGLPPEGHPFNSEAKSFYSYQPGMTGVQIPRPVKGGGPAAAQAKPAYKRADAGKKKRK